MYVEIEEKKRRRITVMAKPVNLMYNRPASQPASNQPTKAGQWNGIEKYWNGISQRMIERYENENEINKMKNKIKNDILHFCRIDETI